MWKQIVFKTCCPRHSLQDDFFAVLFIKNRKELLDRKKGSKEEKGKGKFTEAEVQAMQDVD